MPVLTRLVETLGGGVSIADASGKVLWGDGAGLCRVELDGGFVAGPEGAAQAVAGLLELLAAKENERRDLAGEVLHLYREGHLIGELSEQLAAVLDVGDVGRTALEQAQRLIPATLGGMVVGGAVVAEIGQGMDLDSAFVKSILERGVGEIVNDFVADGRRGQWPAQAVIAAPLKNKQGTIGLIALGVDAGLDGEATYVAAHLKLLNTIAMQAGAAVANALASQKLLEREVERQALQMYLPPQVAEMILSSGGMERLDGVVQPVTVLYADIRGFTTMSERMEARDVVHMLNEFFTAMSGVIFEARGTVDKFIGDCIMALFGAPVESPRAAEDALEAAMGMQQAMTKLNASRLERGLHAIEIGIGIHCGPAVVGNIGSVDRVQYTAIGDTVNVAARLVNLAKAGEIIVSAAVRESIGRDENFEALGNVDLKGRATQMGVYRVR